MHFTKLRLLTLLRVIIFIILPCFRAEKCQKGCDLALASYYVPSGSNLTYISTLFANSISEIMPYNPHLKNIDEIQSRTRLNVPFSCDCLDHGVLGYTFSYVTQKGDTYDKIAMVTFANLTTVHWLERINVYDPGRLPRNVPVNVTVNCSCGDQRVSKEYGLFLTYPLRPGDSLDQVAADAGVPGHLVQQYNPDADFGSGVGLVFVPARDKDGKFPLLGSTSAGLPGSIVAIITVFTVIGALLIAYSLYLLCWRKSAETEEAMLEKSSHGLSSLQMPKYTRITVDKTLEFVYNELVEATNNFDSSRMIGKGGFGSVYSGELRGQKVAIKKMHAGGTASFLSMLEASFLAELKVLTNVQHTNLVQLIGYCVKRSSFLLVYEFAENGSLEQLLRGSRKESLPWLMRMHIALETARGLVYIHDHTSPMYIHRDIKSANILIDKNYLAKVADFGLAKLAGVESSTTNQIKGTHGYLAPEYVQHGELSQKIDIYAFGVVLYELISAKKAVLLIEGTDQHTTLSAMFEEVLNSPNIQDLRDLVDPKLGNDYPFDTVLKVAQLARQCTQEDPNRRPGMRAILVELDTLCSSTSSLNTGLLPG